MKAPICCKTPMEIKRLLLGIIIFLILLIYGVFMMEASQVYYGEDNIKGIFCMFISLAIALPLSMYVGFYIIYNNQESGK